MLGDPKKTTGSHIKTTHTPRRPKEPTSGPLTMIGCRQDTSERPNSNSYPNRNRLHAIQRLMATWETANTNLRPVTNETNRNTHRGHTALARSLLKTNQEHTRSRLTTDSRDDKTGSTRQTRLRDDETHEIHETNEANRRQERRRGNETSTTRLTRYVEIQRPTTVEGRKRLAR